MARRRRPRTPAQQLLDRIPSEALDELLTEEGGPQALLQTLTAALVERALEAELTHHLGYEPGASPPPEQTNRRNGTTSKTLRTQRGHVKVEVPRDREGSYAPILVPKHQRSFDGFDHKVLSLYARGMSTRDIQAHLQELYGTHVSPDLISRVTDAIMGEVEAWQHRPLDAVYPIVYLDAIVVKIRDKGTVQNKSVYLAVGINSDGQKDVLGMWIMNTEGAKFWLAILTELKQRGVQDILVLCADGLTGLPDAVEAAFPATIFQTCIVHMIRSSTRYVPWKERRAVCAKLREVYTASDQAAAAAALDAFEAEYGARYPMVVKAWRSRWAEITPFLAFLEEIRRAVYTTNAIEALNRHLRRTLKTKGHLPSDEAAVKLMYLSIQNATRWKRAAPGWQKALLQFAIYFPGRLPE